MKKSIKKKKYASGLGWADWMITLPARKIIMRIVYEKMAEYQNCGIQGFKLEVLTDEVCEELGMDQKEWHDWNFAISNIVRQFKQQFIEDYKGKTQLKMIF